MNTDELCAAVAAKGNGILTAESAKNTKTKFFVDVPLGGRSKFFAERKGFA
jgi:hypothetical protein